MNTKTKGALAVAAAVGIGVAVSTNSDALAIGAAVAASGPAAILNCTPAVVYAENRYYKLREAVSNALRH